MVEATETNINWILKELYRDLSDTVSVRLDVAQLKIHEPDTSDQQATSAHETFKADVTEVICLN